MANNPANPATAQADDDVERQAGGGQSSTKITDGQFRQSMRSHCTSVGFEVNCAARRSFEGSREPEVTQGTYDMRLPLTVSDLNRQAMVYVSSL